MRALGWIAAGIVVGFMLGGVPAARARVATERRVAELQRELRRASRPDVLGNFLPRLGQRPVEVMKPVAEATAAPTPSREGPDPRDGSRADAGGEGARPAPQGDVAVIGGAQDAPPPARRAPGAAAIGREPAARDPRPMGERPAADPGDGQRDRAERPVLERFDQLASVQRARAAASRQALIEQAGLDDAQVARVDATVARMNDQLTGYGEEMIHQFVRDEPPTPAQALGLGHDVSGILFEGQQELDTIVGEAAEAVDPSAMEVWNYVDVERWRPVLERATAREGELGSGTSGATSGAAGSGPQGGDE